jgi:hypothetical protein
MMIADVEDTEMKPPEFFPGQSSSSVEMDCTSPGDENVKEKEVRLETKQVEEMAKKASTEESKAAAFMQLNKQPTKRKMKKPTKKRKRNQSGLNNKNKAMMHMGDWDAGGSPMKKIKLNNHNSNPILNASTNQQLQQQQK